MSDRPDTLWYTRCPMPTASGLAIEMGCLDEEFVPDGIEVLSSRPGGAGAVSLITSG